MLPVILQRQGQGRLDDRLGAEWAPAQADLPARNQGFVVTRSLRTSSGSATTMVPAGEPIAMDITITSETRVRYVVLDLPLPAGLEGVSRTLGKGRGASVLGGGRGWWVSHEEQRPDRVVVFADDLPPGTHRHTVDLRSTSRGGFNFPPAVAEAMYMPRSTAAAAAPASRSADPRRLAPRRRVLTIAASRRGGPRARDNAESSRERSPRRHACPRASSHPSSSPRPRGFFIAPTSRLVVRP